MARRCTPGGNRRERNQQPVSAPAAQPETMRRYPNGGGPGAELSLRELCCALEQTLGRQTALLTEIRDLLQAGGKRG